MTTPGPATPADPMAWLRALATPQLIEHWTLADWDRIVRLARQQRLLARLAHAIEGAGLTHRLPAAVLDHMVGAQHVSRTRTRAMVWAIRRLPAMLEHPCYPLVLLKGAAYIGQSLPIAEGRLPSDLDILIPAENLEAARFFLRNAGWQSPGLSAHDEHYYLQWSHELPPMTHPRHGVELDVHHNILPPRRGRMLDVAPLLEELRPSRWPGWSVLGPEDQVLHSAAHLFRDPEPQDRLRDLVDLDGLLRHFAVDPGFWPRLIARARRLELVDELALAVHFVQKWFGAPLDATLLRQAGLDRGRSTRVRLLAAAFEAILHKTRADEGQRLASRLAGSGLLLRYHLTRMPLRQTLPHLWHKWRQRRGAAQTAVNAP